MEYGTHKSILGGSILDKEWVRESAAKSVEYAVKICIQRAMGKLDCTRNLTYHAESYCPFLSEAKNGRYYKWEGIDGSALCYATRYLVWVFMDLLK